MRTTIITLCIALAGCGGALALPEAHELDGAPDADAALEAAPDAPDGAGQDATPDAWPKCLAGQCNACVDQAHYFACDVSGRGIGVLACATTADPRFCDGPVCRCTP